VVVEVIVPFHSPGVVDAVGVEGLAGEVVVGGCDPVAAAVLELPLLPPPQPVSARLVASTATPVEKTA
jgi:hypothetical protein